MLNKRLEDIVNRVNHLGSVSVRELAEQFEVAVETVRRDLRVLEREGYLRRDHGLAVSILDKGEGLAFGQRQHENANQKQAIALRAIELIKPGSTIMLDASSSSWYLAKALPDQPLTVITNSLRVTFELVPKQAIKTLTIGGEYSEKYGAFLGAMSTAYTGDYQADIFFFSCVGFQEDTGVWESNEENIAIKKMMLKQSQRSVLLCDLSKIGRASAFRLCDTQHPQYILTEDGFLSLG